MMSPSSASKALVLLSLKNIIKQSSMLETFEIDEEVSLRIDIAVRQLVTVAVCVPADDRRGWFYHQQ